MELPTHGWWLLAGVFADATRDPWCGGDALSLFSASVAGMVFVVWPFSPNHGCAYFHDLESPVLRTGKSFLRFVRDCAFLLLRRDRMANADGTVPHFAIDLRRSRHFF